MWGNGEQTATYKQRREAVEEPALSRDTWILGFQNLEENQRLLKPLVRGTSLWRPQQKSPAGALTLFFILDGFEGRPCHKV